MSAPTTSETSITPNHLTTPTILNQRYQLLQNPNHAPHPTQPTPALDLTTNQQVLIRHIPQPANIPAPGLLTLHHPNLITILDIFKDPTNPTHCFLVQEVLEGQPLAPLPNLNTQNTNTPNTKRWTEDQAIELLLTMLNALKHLHTLNPPHAHANITPQNIIRSQTGRPILTNPQFTGQPTDDLHALALTIIELMSGRHPTDIATYAQRLKLSELTTLTPRFEHILNKMLTQDPQKRFPNAHEAHQKCLALIKGSSIARPSKLPRRRSRQCPVQDPQSTLTYGPDDLFIDIPGRISPKFKILGISTALVSLLGTIWLISALIKGSDFLLDIIYVLSITWLLTPIYFLPAWTDIKIRITPDKFYFTKSVLGFTRYHQGPLSDLFPLQFIEDPVHGKNFKSLQFSAIDFETPLIVSAHDDEKDWLLQQFNLFLTETKALPPKPQSPPNTALSNDQTPW